VTRPPLPSSIEVEGIVRRGTANRHLQVAHLPGDRRRNSTVFDDDDAVAQLNPRHGEIDGRPAAGWDVARFRRIVSFGRCPGELDAARGSHQVNPRRLDHQRIDDHGSRQKRKQCDAQGHPLGDQQRIRLRRGSGDGNLLHQQ